MNEPSLSEYWKLSAKIALDVGELKKKTDNVLYLQKKLLLMVDAGPASDGGGRPYITVTGAHTEDTSTSLHEVAEKSSWGLHIS